MYIIKLTIRWERDYWRSSDGSIRCFPTKKIAKESLDAQKSGEWFPNDIEYIRLKVISVERE